MFYDDVRMNNKGWLKTSKSRDAFSPPASKLSLFESEERGKYCLFRLFYIIEILRLMHQFWFVLNDLSVIC